MNFRKFLPAGAAALLVAGLLSTPALAVKPFSADYTANYMGLQGVGKMTIASAGANKWTYTMSISSSVAKLTQSTTFEDTDGQWRPLSGTDSSLLLIKKSSKAATYDWAKGSAHWSGDVKPERAGPVKLQAGDLDAMLVNLAIVRDAASGKPMRYRMVDDGRVKQLNYHVAGTDKLTIDGKTREATKVSRTDGDKETIVWVVEGLPVPARILQRKNGKDDIDLKIASLK